MTKLSEAEVQIILASVLCYQNVCGQSLATDSQLANAGEVKDWQIGAHKLYSRLINARSIVIDYG